MTTINSISAKLRLLVNRPGLIRNCCMGEASLLFGVSSRTPRRRCQQI